MVYAKFGGQTKCIMGNSKIENGICYFLKGSDVGNLERVLYLVTRGKFPFAYAVFPFHTTNTNAATRKRENLIIALVLMLASTLFSRWNTRTYASACVAGDNKAQGSGPCASWALLMANKAWICACFSDFCDVGVTKSNKLLIFSRYHRKMFLKIGSVLTTYCSYQIPYICLNLSELIEYI